MAARIRQQPARVRQTLLAALDEWVDLATFSKVVTEPHRDWLGAVATAADSDDGWMRQLRAAREEKDMAKRRAALEKLAEEADVGKLPAQSLTRLAIGQGSRGSGPLAVGCRPGQHPRPESPR